MRQKVDIIPTLTSRSHYKEKHSHAGSSRYDLYRSRGQAESLNYLRQQAHSPSESDSTSHNQRGNVKTKIKKTQVR